MSAKDKREICGVVMPISTIDGCTEGHWAEVLEVISSAVENAGFDANLVSNADEVGIIHKRIIQNLYENPIVVCDVSAKNPNVMFELGLRLAFDKPTIIIKDDKTAYSFDTSAIEHLEYPRDLRFSKIVEFKEKLSAKLLATYNRSQTDGEYTTFLKHFGEFKVAKIDKREVSGQEFILEELRSLRHEVKRMDRARSSDDGGGYKINNPYLNRNYIYAYPFESDVDIGSFIKAVESIEGVKSTDVVADESGSFIVKIYTSLSRDDQKKISEKLELLANNVRAKPKK